MSVRGVLGVAAVVWMVGCASEPAPTSEPATDSAAQPQDSGATDDSGAALDAAIEDVAPDSVSEDVAPDSASEVASDAAPEAATIKDLCFSKITKTGGTAGPVYDKFAPTIGAHCYGTNHQAITGVEKVIFLGDSVTVGTPNTKHPVASDNSHFYRNKLAEALATKFSLSKGNLFDWGMWKSYDYVNGVGGKLEAGDFKNCAKWGARTDDFLAGGNQLAKCLPTGKSDKKTLFVFTMGGNDISAITKMGADASAAEVEAGYPTVWAAAKKMVKDLDDAVAWMTDPARFPKGSYVLVGNPFEFTDATGDVDSCAAAGLAGFKDWKKPEVQEAIVVHILESYMEVATKRKIDLVWMLEHFCGHGFVSTKASSPPPGACWLGPGSELWFDETCIHPNDAGHDAIFRFFHAVVNE